MKKLVLISATITALLLSLIPLAFVVDALYPTFGLTNSKYELIYMNQFKHIYRYKESGDSLVLTLIPHDSVLNYFGNPTPYEFKQVLTTSSPKSESDFIFHLENLRKSKK